MKKYTIIPVICLIVLSASVNGRITVSDEQISKISDNLVTPTKNKVTDNNESIVQNTTHKKDESVLINDTVLVQDKVLTPAVVVSNATGVQSNILNITHQFAFIPKPDNGVALILTPFVERGEIKEARNAASVDPDLFMGFKSYSGFLTVNQTYNSNLFFWYFPVENKPVNETPWIIWLQGGPGVSSLTGLFDEIGPFKFKYGTLRRNQYTWLQNHSLVFIDNPVGTGYSFTNHQNGYAKDMTTYGSHLYKAVSQLVQIFPELRSAPLYVSGESYAGKYVPALAMEIHKNKHKPGGDINLQGAMIGNAYVEPSMIAHLTRPFYYFGMLVKEQLNIVKPLVDSFHQDIAANRSIEAKEKFNGLITVLLFLSHQKQGYNFLRDEFPIGHYINFLAQPEIKRALHVGDINFSFVNFTVNTQLAQDFLSNARPLFENLLNHYRVLAYCGHLDQMLPCVYTSECYRAWKWDRSQEFNDAPRYPFAFNEHVAGYYKTGGGFTEAMIRGAGHMVPLDAPGAAQDFITHWITNSLEPKKANENEKLLLKYLIHPPANYTRISHGETKSIKENQIIPEINEIYTAIANLTLNQQHETTPKIDNGTALILSPYIEQGRTLEARNACSVDPDLFLGFKSYSGFLTVNKTYNSNLFFWYFPVEKKPVNETPWIIWLQGGPGASSLTGLFEEIGPFKIIHGTLQRNQYTWLQNHSLVFIDNPVGAGYSFTNHPDGYVKDMATYGSHLYKTLTQFLEIFPELKNAPLYVAGESYAGKYVPALAMEIHRNKHKPGGDINLQGLMIGNAYVEPAMVTQIVRSFYYFGILVKEQVDSLKPLVDSFHKDIAANRSTEAKDKFTSLITALMIMSQQKQIYNFLRDDINLGMYASFLDRSEIKRALHVGDTQFEFINLTVNMVLAPDFLTNSRPLFETLLNYYRVLTYCGHLDQMLPCVITSETYRTWKWDHSQEFLEAARFPYIFNKKLAGYHKTGGGLTEVMVRGAGHMVAMDAPAPAQFLVSQWTHQRPLSSGFGVFVGSFVQEYVRNYTRVASL